LEPHEPWKAIGFKNVQYGDSNKEFDRLEELIEAWRDKVRASYLLKNETMTGTTKYHLDIS
jgi:hypothetical protein